MEDHPGRGEVFDVIVATWCPEDNKHRFDCDETDYKKAIDWHHEVPYPAKYAQGWFQPMPSDEYGTIYVCKSLDCESDGMCDVMHELPCGRED